MEHHRALEDVTEEQEQNEIAQLKSAQDVFKQKVDHYTFGSVFLEIGGIEIFLGIWDQTVGCDFCGNSWWADNFTDDPTMFHAIWCPLYGNRTVASHQFNLEFIENTYLNGKKAGFPGT